MTKKEYILDFLKEINYAYNHPAMYDDLKRLLDEMEEEILESANEALEQQHCDDCISRDKAIVQLNHLKSDWDDDWNVAIRKCIETIKSMPPVTPQPKMGKWLIKRVDGYDHAICSVCGDDSYLSSEWDALELYKYCPNCGAEMQEVEE